MLEVNIKSLWQFCFTDINGEINVHTLKFHFDLMSKYKVLCVGEKYFFNQEYWYMCRIFFLLSGSSGVHFDFFVSCVSFCKH